MKEIYYKVAGHAFALETVDNANVEFDLQQYEPFVIVPTENVVFRLRLSTTQTDLSNFKMEMVQEDEGQSISAGHSGDIRLVARGSQDAPLGRGIFERQALWRVDEQVHIAVDDGKG